MPFPALTPQDLVATTKSNIRETNPDRLLALQSSGAPVKDVRELAEFVAGHLPGAVNIPRGVLEFEVDGHPAVNYQQDPALAHRDQPVVLHCRSGGRSSLAAEALQRLGFSEPLSLAGDFNGWAAAARDVADGVAP